MTPDLLSQADSAKLLSPFAEQVAAMVVSGLVMTGICWIGWFIWSISVKIGGVESSVESIRSTVIQAIERVKEHDQLWADTHARWERNDGRMAELSTRLAVVETRILSATRSLGRVDPGRGPFDSQGDLP